MDLTGTITTNDYWLGHLAAVGEWSYSTPILSFDLSYGGIRIYGNEGDLYTIYGSDDAQLRLRNEIGSLLDFWSSPLGSFPDGLAQIPAPDSWSMSPRGDGDPLILVGPLGRKISYVATHINATLNPPSLPAPWYCRFLSWIFPRRCWTLFRPS